MLNVSQLHSLTHMRQLSSSALCSSILVVSAPPVAWSGTRGSQGVSPLPSQDPGLPPHPSSLHYSVCVCACECACLCMCVCVCVCVFVCVNEENSKHHRMCYNRTVYPLQLRCSCQTFVLQLLKVSYLFSRWRDRMIINIILSCHIQ